MSARVQEVGLDTWSPWRSQGGIRRASFWAGQGDIFHIKGSLVEVGVEMVTLLALWAGIGEISQGSLREAVLLKASLHELSLIHI